jgi:hypothetical protein
MYKASKLYLTASVTALVAENLFSLVAIILRGIVIPEIDDKIPADGTALELRNSLP